VVRIFAVTAVVRFEGIGAGLLAGDGRAVAQIVGDVGPARSHRIRVAFASLFVIAGLVNTKVGVALVAPAPTVIGLMVIESIAICVTLIAEVGPVFVVAVAIAAMLTVEVGPAVIEGVAIVVTLVVEDGSAIIETVAVIVTLAVEAGSAVIVIVAITVTLAVEAGPAVIVIVAITVTLAVEGGSVIIETVAIVVTLAVEAGSAVIETVAIIVTLAVEAGFTVIETVAVIATLTVVWIVWVRILVLITGLRVVAVVFVLVGAIVFVLFGAVLSAVWDGGVVIWCLRPAAICFRRASGIGQWIFTVHFVWQRAALHCFLHLVMGSWLNQGPSALWYLLPWLDQGFSGFCYTCRPTKSL